MPNEKSKKPLLLRSPLRVLRRRFWLHPINDFVGGLMAAIVALPLCLAFGVASGLGAAAGLYGAVACGIFAAVFGGTPGQCSGPTGPMTVVAAAVYSANPDRPELVFAVVIAAGLMQIALGYSKAAQLIHYLPYPVLSGFMIGIGVIILCIQVAPLFGLPGTANVLSAIQNFPTIFTLEQGRHSCQCSNICMYLWNAVHFKADTGIFGRHCSIFVALSCIESEHPSHWRNPIATAFSALAEHPIYRHARHSAKRTDDCRAWID
jgi:hypothetical protein